MSNLQVVTDRRWMVEELSATTLLSVRSSHGLDIPVHTPDDAWWIAQGIATRFQLSGVNWRLQSPGPNWLGDLPLKYAGREVESLSLSQLAQRDASTIAHIKFAEAKSEVLVAAVRTVGEAVALLEKAGVPEDSALQLSEVLELDSEWRFYVREGKVVAHSGYLTRAEGQEFTYYDRPVVEGEGFAQAATLANEVAARVDAPAGYTLDVARTVAGEALVLEANPAWCSAWYGAQIDPVVRTIIAACKPSTRWAWRPDASMLARYARARALPWRSQSA